MAGGLINEDYTDYTKAFGLFKEGKALVNEGRFDEGLDLLRQSYNMVGRDGAKNMTILLSEANTTDGFMAEFHELMGRGYLGQKKYEQAIEHFKQWMEELTTKYGQNSIKLAQCHLWMARTWKNINTYGFNVDASFQKNMEKPIYHYKTAYELLESQNGNPGDLSALKAEITQFFISKVCTLQMIKSIWMSFLLIPLAILILIIWGFTWHSLTIILIFIAAFLLWRAINLALVLWLTWKHHSTKVI